MTQLNSQAVSAAALLRAIAATPDARPKELAEASGRHPNHIARDLKSLECAGLITVEPRALTDEGRAQLAMIGRAEHGGDKRRVPGHWPIDKIRPNPANRPIDPATIPGLADTVEDEGVLQPALLTPPDASGVRMLLAGERRWRALCHLRAEGRADDKVEQGLPFIEKEADEPTALLITLIENGQRQDLSPWEDAQQLLALQIATGWSAREIAKKTGRSPEGSDTGVRDVQQKIKVAREATAEAIADYARTNSWDQLRDSVTKPKPASDRPDPVSELSQLLAEHNPPPSGEGDHAQHGGGGRAAEQAHAEDSGFVLCTLVAGERYRERFDRRNPDQTAGALQSDIEWGERGYVDLDEALEPGTLETFALPHARPHSYAKHLFPHAQIQIARLKGADGWVAAGGYSLSDIGSHSDMRGISRDTPAYPSRDMALAAGIDAIAEGIDRNKNGKIPRAIFEWLQNPTKAGPHVVDHVDYVTAERAAAARGSGPAQTTTSGSRGSQPVPASDSASRALAELARWERDAPRAFRLGGAVRIDRVAAWQDPAFRQLKEAALIRVEDHAGGPDGTRTYATIRPSGREWLATKGTGFVAAVHNTTVWKTPWIAKVGAAPALPQPMTVSPAAAPQDASAFTPSEDQTIRLVTMIEALCDALDETAHLIAHCRPSDPGMVEQADELFDRHGQLLETIEDRLAAEDLPARCSRAQEGEGEESPGATPGTGPAVPVRRSITPDHITCLEDGRRFVGGLKRHLRTRHNLSPEQYREKWGLPADYPMVAPNFAKQIDDRRRALGIDQ